MANQYFQFKQFKIQQDCTAMKVGTDGVLLGAWADVENATAILDIGTGTGLIALMAAQRNKTAIIDAVEIDPDACRQARENVSDSPWNGRIRIYNTSIFDFSPEKKYDTIICNPPFFINSTRTPAFQRTIARHCENFSHTGLLCKVSQLLAPNGNFCMILPPVEAENVIHYASQKGLHAAQIVLLHPTPKKPVKRFLIKFTGQLLETMTTELILETARHQYSEESTALFKEFYLNL